MAKTRLASMTWKEAEEAFASNPVILIPSASIEQHGPQTPVGDFRVGEIAADRIAEQTGAIVAPMFAYGYSDTFRRFPGTITLEAETVHNVMYDVARSFLDHGLDHLVFLCCHNGNMPILEHVGRRIRREYGVRMGCLEPWRLFSPSLIQEVYGQPNPRIGHGSEPFTSFSLQFFPDDVRLDLLEEEQPISYEGVTRRGTTQVALDDVNGHIYFDTKDFAPNGVVGDVTLHDPEAGQRLMDKVVELGTEYVNIFKQHDTHIQ